MTAPPTPASTDAAARDFIAACDCLYAALGDPAWQASIRAADALDRQLALLAAARTYRLVDAAVAQVTGRTACDAQSLAVQRLAHLLSRLGAILGAGDRDPLTTYDATFAALRRALPADSAPQE